MGLQRRTVLVRALAALAALALGRPAGAVSPVSNVARLREAIGNPVSLRIVGAHCAAALPEGSGVSPAAGLPLHDTASARERLRQRIRDDFRAGRVVVVDGWRLAETEARLYAMLA